MEKLYRVALAAIVFWSVVFGVIIGALAHLVPGVSFWTWALAGACVGLAFGAGLLAKL